MLRVWRAVTVGIAVFRLVGAGAGGGLSLRRLLAEAEAEAEGAGLFPVVPVYAFLLPRRGVVGKAGGVGCFTTAGGAGAASLEAAVTLLVVILLVEPPLADTPCPCLRFERGTGALAVVAGPSLFFLAGGLTLCLPFSTFLFLACNVAALLEAVTSCRSPF